MTAWKIRRGDEETEIASTDELRAMVRSGHLRKDQYVFNPVLNQWLYARDVAELSDSFRAGSATHLNSISWTLFAFSILFGFLRFSLFSGLTFLAAIGFAIAYYVARGKRSSPSVPTPPRTPTTPPRVPAPKPEPATPNTHRNVTGTARQNLGKNTRLFLGGAAVVGVPLVLIFLMGMWLFPRRSANPAAAGQTSGSDQVAHSNSGTTSNPGTRPSRPITPKSGDERPDVSELQDKLDDENAKIDLQQTQREWNETNETPDAEGYVTKQGSLRHEYVYADPETRIFHRRRCAEYRSAFVRLLEASAIMRGIHAHDGCKNVKPESSDVQIKTFTYREKRR
jgi:hypothetical protein